MNATDNLFEFYCEATDDLPSLEIKVIRENDKYYLTYLREDNISDDFGIVWDSSKEPMNKGKVFVYKTKDNDFNKK